MKAKLITASLSTITALLLTGCGSINMTEYKPVVTPKQQIPTVCEKEFRKDKPSVVVEIKESFNIAETDYRLSLINQNTDFKSTSYKMLQDQILHQAVLADNKILAHNDFVPDYTIEASIDTIKIVNNITTKYYDATQKQQVFSDVNKYYLFRSNGKYDSPYNYSGYVIEVGVTLKIFDKGKNLIAIESFADADTTGEIGYNDYNSFKNSINRAVKYAVQKADPFLLQNTGRTIYINEIRKNDKDDFVAQINRGTNNGIKQGSEYDVFTLSEGIDYVTDKPFCNKIKQPQTITIGDNISDEYSWGKVSDASKTKPLVLKVGDILSPTPIKTFY